MIPLFTLTITQPMLYLFRPVFDVFSGLLFALQFFSFLAFCAYCLNEVFHLTKGSRFLDWLRKQLVGVCLNYGLVRVIEPEETPTTITKKMISVKFRDQVQSKIAEKDSFETAHWLNALLFEILCTSKSRRLIDADQEALLAALTRISREAVESRLSSYQKESWLFLSSLDLDSFSFGDRLPVIENIHIPFYKANSFALVMDISYTGGIKVGLKAAMAMNFRDFAATINFTPSQFKFILKFDAEATPRISFMLSDVPSYEMTVTMRSQQLERATNLIKLIIGNFMRTRFCYPNYLTVLFRSTNNQSPQFANAKQFQSQLRVRLVSVNLNPEHEAIIPAEELNVMAALSLGPDLTSKTETINAELKNTRWNSIHTFNVFNGLENTPKCLQISLYQVIDASLNQLGRIEVTYPSITPGLLDIRTLPLSTDPSSSMSLEMYLHHMEEDGSKDANWIFWNCPKPPKRKTEQDKSIDQVNWESIKFVLSKLSTDEIATETIEEAPQEVELMNSSIKSVTSVYEDVPEDENLLNNMISLLEKTITRLQKYHLEPETVDILVAFWLELEDFTKRFNLTRQALSAQALPAHNQRLASLFRPLVKSFIPEALKRLEHLNVYDSRVQKTIRDLDQIMQLTVDSSNIQPVNDSSPDLAVVEEGSIGGVLTEFDGYFGDLHVNVSIDELNGLSFKTLDSTDDNRPQFDYEGIFYTNNNNNTSISNLGSAELFNDLDCWEVALLQNQFLVFVPLGTSHLFPQRVIDINEIVDLELIKDRNAFTLGFNADLSTKEALNHVSNGLLRITMRDRERIDLFGESRSCDQWYCILSRKDKPVDKALLSWKDIEKIWLLPLNLPSLIHPYALAIRHEGLSHVLIINSELLYRAYCRVKTLWHANREKEGMNLLSLPRSQNRSNSSSSSLTASPESQKSTVSLLSLSQSLSRSLSRSFSSSIASNASNPIDPFASKSRFDRLKMAVKPSGQSNYLLMMSSIDDLRVTTVPWTSRITDNAAVFSCSLSTFPSILGFIAVGSEFICFWTSLKTLPLNPRQPAQLLLLPRSEILNISKLTPNWVSSFSGIALTVKGQRTTLVLTSFNSAQELELVFESLLHVN